MELSILLPVISAGIAGMAFYYARKKETKEDTAQSAEMIVELRAMREDVSELKSDFKALRAEMRQDHDDIVGLKRDFKTMWQRIDELKELIGTK